MSVAILRASSQCLRGPRGRVQGAVCMMEDGAALGVVIKVVIYIYFRHILAVQSVF